MAFQRPVQKKAAEVLEVPSLYGSHASMIVVASWLRPWLVLRDEKGVYETTRDRLDTGLADPRRYDSSRIIETPNVKAVVKK